MREITNLDELKEIELNIMKKIHTFCMEHNIKYCLCYGSLIGAIRHKGFIPWDDDIDIFMTRPEYEKFLAEFPLYADSMQLEIVNHKTKRYFGRNLSKVIDTNTVLKETQYKTDDEIGVFVDIWPVDGTPNNRIKRFIYCKYAIFLKKLILAASMRSDPDYGFGKRMIIHIAGLFNPKKLTKRMDTISQKYRFENSKYVKCYAADHILYNRNDFDEQIKMEFENQLFWGPKNYDSMLRMEYGDYMQLPAVENRKPHHIINAYYKADSSGGGN